MTGNHRDSTRLAQYQAEIGDTERSVEEIINTIKGYGEPIVAVALNSKAADYTANGSVIDITVKASLDAQELKQLLNESGGCMYQVTAVNKNTR